MVNLDIQHPYIQQDGLHQVILELTLQKLSFRELNFRYQKMHHLQVEIQNNRNPVLLHKVLLVCL